MKIWALSDTHNKHHTLEVPEDIDCVLFAGDATNYYDITKNEVEFNDFVNWYANLDIPKKIFVAGNHDASLKRVYNKDLLRDSGIDYLEHEYHEYNGITFFGSPWTPTFGNWYFTTSRDKIGRKWDMMDTPMDILITHGPPKGMLDLCNRKYDGLEQGGDRALLKAVERLQPEQHIFGHIHNHDDVINFGIRVHDDIVFRNVSCVRDGAFSKGCENHGQIFEM